MADPVHLCDWAEQPDIRIACTRLLTQPARGQNDGPPWRTDEGERYAFDPALVTCEACKVVGHG